MYIYTPIKFMEFEQWMTSNLDRLDIRSLLAIFYRDRITRLDLRKNGMVE